MLCNNCGCEVVDPYKGVKNRCRSCSKAKATEWNRKNPGRVRERCRVWHQKNSDSLNAKARERWSKRPPRLVKHWVRGIYGPPKPSPQILWLAKYQPFLLLAAERLWLELEELERKKIAERGLKKRVRLRIKYKARRHRRRGAQGKFRKADIDRLFLFQRGKCVVCRVGLDKFHIDHVMPIALGGTNEPSNLQLLCANCNQDKGAKHPISFMQERGLLL